METNSIEETTNIESLKTQLADLENLKRQKEIEIAEEIARQKKMEAELESKNYFKDWTPSVKSVKALFDLMEDEDKVSMFKDLEYELNAHEFILEEYKVNFGDGWRLEVEYVHGGGEGDGSEHYAILKVTKDNQNPTYYMVPGYYESYNGGELEIDCLYQVRPFQKMVTDYEKV